MLDSGPLIALAIVGELRVLQHLYARAVVPDAVLSEILAGPVERPGARDIQSASWLERVQLDSPPEPLLIKELGAGEAEAIALAARLEGAVILDERAGRRIAREVYGLQVRGTVGILAAAKRAGHLSQLRPVLQQLKTAGYYLTTEIIDGAARSVGE